MNVPNVLNLKNKGLKNIFISYREKDSAGETGRLVDALKQHFLEEQIFMDIDKIEPGVDFTDVISSSLECCDVMLAVIGPNWMGVNEQTNTSRIKDPNDWVRLEIATALQRNIRVVPVLVDGASLPSATDLPDDLQPLLRRQAYEISNKRWRYDTDQLISFLEKSVGVPPAKRTVTPAPAKKISLGGTVKWVLIAAGAFFILIMILYAMGVGSEDEKTSLDKSNVSKQTEASPVSNTQDNTNTPAETEQKVVRANETVTSADISGTWNDANGLYYMVFTQNGSQLDVKSYALNGQKTGEGFGAVNGKDVTFKIAIDNFGTISANAKVTAGETNIKGSTSVESNGYSYSEPLLLIKNTNQ